MTDAVIAYCNTFFTAFLFTCALMFVPAVALSVRKIWAVRRSDPIRWQWIDGVFWLTVGLALLFGWMTHNRYVQQIAMANAVSVSEWGFAARLVLVYAFVKMMRAATFERCREVCWVAMVGVASAIGACVTFFSNH